MRRGPFFCFVLFLFLFDFLLLLLLLLLLLGFFCILFCFCFVFVFVFVLFFICLFVCFCFSLFKTTEICFGSTKGVIFYREKKSGKMTLPPLKILLLRLCLEYSLGGYFIIWILRGIILISKGYK